MKILNNTTGQIENLTYSPTGSDCMGDLTASDESFTYNRETETHEAEESAIDWWRAWIAAQEELDTLWASVKEDFDDENIKEIRQAMERAQDCDMEDQPRAGKAAIMEWMREHDYVLKTYDDGSVAFIPDAALEYEDAEDRGDPYPSLADIVGCLKGVEPLALEKEPDREFRPMDIKETIERDLSYIRSLEALSTLIEETAEGHPYTIVFTTEADYDGATNPIIQVTRTRPETPDEEMRRQKMERSKKESQKINAMQDQRRAEVERILGNLTLEDLRKCQPLTKEETA